MMGIWKKRGKGRGNKKHKYRYKRNRGRVRIVWEMEKPKNLYVQPIDMNEGGGNAGRRRGRKGRKKMGQL